MCNTIDMYVQLIPVYVVPIDCCPKSLGLPQNSARQKPSCCSRTSCSDKECVARRLAGLHRSFLTE